MCQVMFMFLYLVLRQTALSEDVADAHHLHRSVGGRRRATDVHSCLRQWLSNMWPHLERFADACLQELPDGATLRFHPPEEFIDDPAPG